MKARIPPWLLLLVLGAGSALPAVADPLYYGTKESAEAATARVVEFADIDADSLQPARLSELLSERETSISGEAEILPCDGGASTMSTLQGIISQVEGQVGYMEFDEAMVYLDQATASLNCLRDRINSESAARLHFLEGIAAHGAGNLQRARSAFSSALFYEPELEWDNYFAPDAASLLELARSELQSAPRHGLRIAPSPATGTLWINGHLESAEGGLVHLPAGMHMVQMLVGTLQTWRVNLTGEATLVIPSAVSNDFVEWLDDRLDQSDMEAVLSATLEANTTVYFTSPSGTTWKTVVGSGRWEPLSSESAAEISEPTSNALTDTITSAPTPGRSPLSSSFVVGGTVLLTSGATMSALSYILASKAYEQGQQAPDWGSFAANNTKYNNWQQRLLWSEIAAGGGAALLCAGIGLRFVGETQVWAIPLDGGLGLGVRASR